MYFFSFDPILKRKIWGGTRLLQLKGKQKRDIIGESWEISAISESESIVSNGEFAGKTLTQLVSIMRDDLLGKDGYERFNGDFPLLVKFIDACQDLSVQVHPNRESQCGKDELWYIIDASENSSIYAGFKPYVTKEVYKKSILNNDILTLLNKHDIKKGETCYIPAGCVHSLGRGCFVCEIQQSSDITYRIYDYNRRDGLGKERVLHLELAAKAISFDSVPIITSPFYNQNMEFAICDKSTFSVSLLNLSYTYLMDLSKINCFVIFICVSGKVILENEIGEVSFLKTGDSLLVAAKCSTIKMISKSENVQLLKCFIR